MIALLELIFFRVKVLWNTDQPLRFKFFFQFGVDENTILSFKYERLCNFCQQCGLLSHEKKDFPPAFDNDQPPLKPDNDDNDDKEDELGPDDVHDIADNAILCDVVPPVAVIKGLQAINEAPPAAEAHVDEYVLDLFVDEDMQAEMQHYKEAKLAKGKFREDEFIDIFEA